MYFPIYTVFLECIVEDVVCLKMPHLSGVPNPIVTKWSVAEEHLGVEFGEGDAFAVQIYCNLVVARLLLGKEPFVVIIIVIFHYVVVGSTLHELNLAPLIFNIFGQELEVLSVATRYPSVA